MGESKKKQDKARTSIAWVQAANATLLQCLIDTRDLNSLLIEYEKEKLAKYGHNFEICRDVLTKITLDLILLYQIAGEKMAQEHTRICIEMLLKEEILPIEVALFLRGVKRLLY